MLGCLQRLVLLPLIVALFYPLFSLRSPFPTLVLFEEGAEVAAFLSGLFTWWCVISWLDMRQMATDIALTRDWVLKDGERTVVSGHVEAQNESVSLLTAPFSGEKCLGYWYNVSHYKSGVGQHSGRWWTDYGGYALVPSIIRGPMRTVSVLADPDKELFNEIPSHELESKEQWSRAEKFLEQTDFGEMPSGRLADTRKRLIHDGPGNFREDKAVGEPPENLWERRKIGNVLKDGATVIKEGIIKEGETVLISGIYSTDRSGIVPDPDSIMRPFHLVVGGDAVLKKKMHNRVIGMAISGALALGVAATYFLVFVPRS